MCFLRINPESSAHSPLSWLLSEYLDNAESARRCKSRAAIFNSRVRRLTHLLVHVDTSQLDSEELKPPVKSSEYEAAAPNSALSADLMSVHMRLITTANVKLIDLWLEIRVHSWVGNVIFNFPSEWHDAAFTSPGVKIRCV